MWEEIQEKFIAIKDEHDRQSKRAIKAKPPKQTAVREEITQKLVELYNQNATLAKNYWKQFTPEHKQWINRIFNHLRDRTVRAFTILNVRYVIPWHPTELIDTTQVTEIEDSDEETEESDHDEEVNNEQQDDMALTVSEFFNLADKILPKTFNGESASLNAFIDALNLLKENCGDHTSKAIALVKTRLTGKARLAITDDIRDLDGIIRALKTRCPGDKSHVIEEKLTTVRQNNLDANRFTKEIDELSEALLRAYISEGVPNETADRLVKSRAIRTMANNARSDKTRLAMEVGNFETVQDALTKFVTIDNMESRGSVLFINQNKRGRGRYNNMNSNRGQYNNFYRNQRQFHGNRQEHGERQQSGQRSYYNYNNNRGSNNNSGRNRNWSNTNRHNQVRVQNMTTFDQENSQDPLPDRLGDNN